MTSSSPANPDSDLPVTLVLRGRQGRLLAGALLVFGLLFSFTYVARGWLATPWLTLLPLPVAAALASFPFVQRWTGRVIELLNSVGRRRPVATSLSVAVIAAILLLGIALAQNRSFELLWHDELSYLVQTRIVQAGRLWMPPHPLGDFFDTFHFVQRPVYGSMYPPGTAIVFAPLLALGLPAWGGALLITSLAMGLLYSVIGRLIDPVAGLLVVFMAIALHPVRLVSLMLLSQPVILLLGLLMLWAMLSWLKAFHHRRHSQAWAWMAVLGAATGMAALTRPLDALCIALPILALVVWELAQKVRQARETPADGVSWRTAATMLLVGLVATAPFLAVQGWTNARTTGHPLESLYSVYHRQHYPELMPGFHDYEIGPPRFELTQKQVFFESYTQPFLLRHSPQQVLRDWFDPAEAYRASSLFGSMMPGELLAALLPLGLLFLRDRRRVAIVVAIVPFCIAYSLYAVFMRHYAVAILPAILLPVAAAVREGPALLSPGRGRRWAATFAPVLLITACLLQWPPLFPQGDEGFDPHEMTTLRQQIAKIEHESAEAGERAIILFRFDADAASAQVEPVYNIETAWPDDAPVIRAHDLGRRNVELYRYYAQRQPDRVVYLLDRATYDITRLGTVASLSEPRQTPAMADEPVPGA